MPRKITTIKLQKYTKDRIDKLKVYPRETYDEIIQEMLDILNICKINPYQARQRLLAIERQRDSNTKKSQKSSSKSNKDDVKDMFRRVMEDELNGKTNL